MIAIIGGLATAVFWAVSVLVSARASRLVGASSTVAGAMAIGLGIGLPVALAFAPEPDFGGAALLWMAMSGFGNVAGLLLTYTAYRIGAVGIISTIDSTEGAVAAVISVLAGEVLVPGSGIVLAVIAVGVVLAASAGGSEEGVAISRDRATRAAALAVLSALCFALGLYGSARAATVLPVAWAILPPRFVGVVFVAIPLLVLGRFRMSRAALPLVAATGVVEVLG
jgi:drug/metabolite transporter (DMT)-like permease